MKILRIKHLEEYLSGLNMENLKKQTDRIIKNKILLYLYKDNMAMQKNPYFLLYLLKNDYWIDYVDFNAVLYYKEFYKQLKTEIIRRNIPYIESNDLLFLITHNETIEILCNSNNKDFIIKIKEIMNVSLNFRVNIRLVIDVNNSNIVFDNFAFFKELRTNKRVHLELKYYKSDKVFNLEEILKDEEFLNKIVKEIESFNFSPLEKFIALYDITKNIKQYKSEGINEPISYSRGLYEILHNNYIVCAGFSNILESLCKRVQIPCISKSVLTEYQEFHRRNFVNIEDFKYHINGFFISDSTWGNKELDYNFMLMTFEEAKKRGNIKIDNLNSFLLYKSEKHLDACLTKSSNLEKSLKDFIKALDPSFYVKIFDKNFRSNVSLIYNYLKNKIDNTYSDTEILKAIINVKKRIFKNFNEEQFLDLQIFYYESYRKVIKRFSDYESIYQSYIKERLEIVLNKTFLEIAQKKFICDLIIFNKYLKSIFNLEDLQYDSSAFRLLFYTNEEKVFKNLKNFEIDYEINKNIIIFKLPIVCFLNITLKEYIEELFIQVEIIYSILEKCNSHRKKQYFSFLENNTYLTETFFSDRLQI